MIEIVVPVFNEENVFADFYEELVEILVDANLDYRIILVDDGSGDRTLNDLIRISQENDRVFVVELSRNFGHQAAISAGLDLCEGEMVIVMDGDGQHPPAMIPEMIKLAEQGYDIVLTQRLEQREIGFFKRTSSDFFYWLINLLSATRLESRAGDFKLMKKNVREVLQRMPEYHRFLRGMIAWMGFHTIVVPYQPRARIGGNTKYTLRKMLRLGMDAIFSFSLTPLYIVILIGLLFLLLATAEIIYVLSFWLRGVQGQLEPGWSSLMFVLLFIGGSILISIGIVGIYIGYIFLEVKHRPVYIIRTIYTSHTG